MGYLDERDWRGADDQVRDILSELCSGCPHYRYLHGQAWKDTGSALQYRPGACTVDRCACTDFLEAPPISQEDIIDAHDELRGIGTLDALLAILLRPKI